MRKYLLTFKLGIINALNYRGNMLSGFCVYTMFIVVFFYLWRAIYSTGDIAGLSLTQIVWYLCITEIVSFGANTRVYGQVAQDVKSGDIAYQLLRPYGYVGYRFASAMGPALINTVMFGLLGAALGFITVGGIPGYRIWTLIPGLVMLMLGIAIYFFAQMSIGLLAFFVEETSGFNLLLSKGVMMLGTFMPIEILPGWLKSIVQNLPFSYISWAPARILVGFEWELFARAITMQLIYLIAFMALCAVMMRAGRKSIQANGG
jgi:ABC-2 type transport system permease protein